MSCQAHLSMQAFTVKPLAGYDQTEELARANNYTTDKPYNIFPLSNAPLPHFVIASSIYYTTYDCDEIA